jgi:hypothetical protein
MSPVIDIHDATFSGFTYDSARRMVANPGDSIRCSFKLRNTGSTNRQIWWAINDGDERIASGTGFLDAGDTVERTRSITMPNSQLNLKFWAGYISNGTWYWTDNAGFNPIYVAPQMSAINFVTTPVGASIYIDGIYKGITSSNVEVNPGFRSVMVALTGFETETESIYVSAGETASFYALLKEKPTDGTLAIGSSPHDARIYVNGVYRGTTPATQYKYITIPAGLHSVKLTRDGYQDATTNAQVDVDKTTYYNPVLELATGQVYVTGELSDGTTLTGAEIYVDGVATGVFTPGTVTTSAGRHTIVAKKEV